MRADRLLSILLLLQNQGKLTSRSLADKLEVSERTIMRDMEALSMSGVPVFAERGSQGGWFLTEGYRTNLTGMKAEEFISLVISAHPGLLTDLGIKEHFDSAFQKLLASSPASLKQSTELVRQKIHIDGAGWHQGSESNPYLTIVQEAVWAECKLCIHYKRNQDIAVRIVHPIGLVAKRSVWYLVAEINGEFRTYRISRIVHAELLQATFSRPKNFDLAQYWEESTAEFKQSVPSYLTSISMRSQLLPRLEQQRYIRVLQLEPEEKGWIKALIDCETIEYGCETILSFGASVEVISPPELRAMVLSESQAIVDLYTSK